MSVFKLPNSWCEEINSMVDKFWWGANNEELKIHSKRWDTMTLAKEEGAFRFRELTSFNTSLLANSAARLISEPNVLWVQLLKCLYFPNSEFIHAAKGSRASWGWSNLLAGRAVL